MGAITRQRLFEQLVSKPSEAFFANTSLDEYTQALDRQQVMHLLRRTTFGMSHETINKYVGKRASEIVDDLFAKADAKLSPTKPPFVNETIKNPTGLSGQQREVEEAKKNKQLRNDNVSLSEWWISLMKSDHNSVLEKMVFFWHSHFATQYTICNGIPATAMYNQLDLFRKNYSGNFFDLLTNISIDSAMLLYLNGNENIAESPNENYARELMELFSIGVGNYSEQDVREGAKILTGWQTSMFISDTDTPNKGTLNPSYFDKTSKIFMGDVFTVNYEVNKQNVFNHSVKRLIKTLLTFRSKEAAKFMASKFYKYFVYSNNAKSNKAVIETMAIKIQEHNFEFRPMLKALFSSQHFFDKAIVGGQISSPLDTIIPLSRYFNFPEFDIRRIMADLGLDLLNPPNVAGWKGHRSWITTKSLPSTIFFLKEIIKSNSNLQIAKWVDTFNNINNISQTIESLGELLLVQNKAEDRLKRYQSILLQNAPDYEWYEISKNKELMGQRVRNLLFEIIKAPDYYLH